MEPRGTPNLGQIYVLFFYFLMIFLWLHFDISVSKFPHLLHFVPTKFAADKKHEVKMFNSNIRKVNCVRIKKW